MAPKRLNIIKSYSARNEKSLPLSIYRWTFPRFYRHQIITDERPETLYPSILVFVSGNLVTVAGGISHHGEFIDQDEELSTEIEESHNYYMGTSPTL